MMNKKTSWMGMGFLALLLAVSLLGVFNSRASADGPLNYGPDLFMSLNINDYHLDLGIDYYGFNDVYALHGVVRHQDKFVPVAGTAIFEANQVRCGITLDNQLGG